MKGVALACYTLFFCVILKIVINYEREKYNMKRKINIANFNLTYGDNDEPMLSHFDDILYPALKSNIKKESFNRTGTTTSYFLMDIKIENNKSNNYILTGLIVKDTILEIKSQMNGDNLVDTDYTYKSAPYSYFCINLINHRMYLVKNQSGSPDLRSFKSTVEFILREYVNKRNQELNDEKDLLPVPFIEVLGIPYYAKIQEELQKVEKIQSLTLNFFPLNGDTDFSEAFKSVSDIRINIDSKNGSVKYNNPKNIEKVGELLKETNGTVDPKVRVKYKNSSRTATIEGSQLTEQMTVELTDSEEGIKEYNNIQQISNSMEKSETLNNIKGNHKKIYDNYKNKIISMLNKK